MIIRNEKGSALLIMLIVLVVAMTLSTVFIFAMNNELRQSVIHDNKVQAYYYARSGAEAAYQWLYNNNFVLDSNKYMFGDFEGLQLSNNAPGTEESIEVEMEKLEGEIVISSKGAFQGNTETVILTFESIPSIDPFDSALFALGAGSESMPAIKLTGSSEIEGHVGTNSIGENSVQFDWSTAILDGDLYVGPEGDPEKVVNEANHQTGNVPEGEIYAMSEARSYPQPIFPDFPDDLEPREDFRTDWVEGEYYEINEDGFYDLISVFGNRTLTIDLKGGTRIIRVKDLDISQGHIELKNVGESGRLILYVEDSFTLGGSSTVNKGEDFQNVMVYYKGISKPSPSIGGNTRFFGSFFAKSGHFDVAGSNGVIGHIITGGNKVNISGDADMNTRVFYAPNAYVSIEGSGRIKGSLISKRAALIGNARVFYEEPDMSTFPTEIFPSDWKDKIGGAAGGGWQIKQWR